MKASELALQYLREEGFVPHVDEDNGNIIFKYQRLTFILINDEDDELYFCLWMPAIFDVTEDNRAMVLEAANETNKTIKFVKILVADDCVHAAIENMLDQDPELSIIMPRSLDILTGARDIFYEQLQ